MPKVRGQDSNVQTIKQMAKKLHEPLFVTKLVDGRLAIMHAMSRGWSWIQNVLDQLVSAGRRPTILSAAEFKIIPPDTHHQWRHTGHFFIFLRLFGHLFDCVLVRIWPRTFTIELFEKKSAGSDTSTMIFGRKALDEKKSEPWKW